MSSIGPQLPPHLAKRKRTPEDEGQDQPSSPRSKNARVATVAPPPPHNTDELALEDSDSDSDDGYGPRAPQPAAVGPSHPLKGSTDEIGLDDSDSASDAGPRPLPGPSLPQTHPAPATAAAAAAADDDDSSSDDDDYGPALPSKTAARPQIGPSMPPVPTSDDTPQRDSWMLAPPTATGYTERDPTKLKARKFASSKGSASKQAAGAQPASIWTETPEEKLRRLQDSVLGRTGSGPGAESASDVAAAARARDEEERSRRIAASVEAQRGKSLMDEHGSKRKQQGEDKEEEDDPSKRAFDREKDMALGGKIGAAKRKELLNKAADFGGRFQKGSFL